MTDLEKITGIKPEHYDNRIICWDFDGVINPFRKGWQGVSVIDEEPTPGIIDILIKLYEAGYINVICSARCNESGGKDAIIDYCLKYGFLKYIESISSNKPSALAYIDDRAIRFDGNTSNLYEQIINFKSWNR